MRIYFITSKILSATALLIVAGIVTVTPCSGAVFELDDDVAIQGKHHYPQHHKRKSNLAHKSTSPKSGQSRYNPPEGSEAPANAPRPAESTPPSDSQNQTPKAAPQDFTSNSGADVSLRPVVMKTVLYFIAIGIVLSTYMGFYLAKCFFVKARHAGTQNDTDGQFMLKQIALVLIVVSVAFLDIYKLVDGSQVMTLLGTIAGYILGNKAEARWSRRN